MKLITYNHKQRVQTKQLAVPRQHTRRSVRRGEVAAGVLRHAAIKLDPTLSDKTTALTSVNTATDSTSTEHVANTATDRRATSTRRHIGQRWSLSAGPVAVTRQDTAHVVVAATLRGATLVQSSPLQHVTLKTSTWRWWHVTREVSPLPGPEHAAEMCRCWW